MGGPFLPIQDIMKQLSILLFFLTFSSAAWTQSANEDPNDQIGREDGTSVSSMSLVWGPNGFQPYIALDDEESQLTLASETETPFRPEGNNGISNDENGRPSGKSGSSK